MIYVYLLGSRRHKVLKVGVSKAPAERMAELQKTNPYPLEMFAEVAIGELHEAVEFEAGVHRLLARQKLRGEWFKLSGLAKALVTAAQKEPTPSFVLRAVEIPATANAELGRMQCGAQNTHA